MRTYTESEVLNILKDGEFIDAEDLLGSELPKIKNRMKASVKNLAAVLRDVKKVFPDAIFYTASGGLVLMLGRSHGDHDVPQQELIAISCSELIHISDGDF